MLENFCDAPSINSRIKKPSNILTPSERRLKQAIQPGSSHINSVYPTKNLQKEIQQHDNSNTVQRK